jgi:hypothetical protein
MATPKLSLVKTDVHDLGKKCKQLQDARAHAKTGTYMRDLAEMRIPYHTAQRAIKFYVRAKKAWKAKLLQNAKDKKWLDAMGIEDLDELDRLQESQQADARLAALADIRDKAIEQVMNAVSKRKEQPSGHRVVLSLSEPQREKFRKAWQSLGENEGTSIVYKAVLNAAKEN